jgi:LysM repeat protein
MQKSALKLWLILTVLLLTIALPAAQTAAQAGAVAWVNTGRLNVRSGPSLAFKDITSIPYNTEVTLLGRAQGTTWVQVSLPTGQQGWVNFLYLRSYATLSSLPITYNQPVPPTNPGPMPGGQQIYVVRAGDTLKSIAARYGTTWQVLAAVNSLPNANFIYVGQRLIIAYTVPSYPTTPSTPGTGGVRYVVRQGDTLQSIATRYGTTWQAIAATNNLANPNAIYAGQTLVIPPQTPQPRYYTVRPGDTLYSIAVRYGTTPGIIAAANNIFNYNLVYAGQTLTIP